jgi:uncharacterized protein YceK
VIHLALFIVLVLTSGCASQTAMISQAATSSAASAALARAYLVRASAELDSIEAQANAVHQAIPFVSDDQPAIYSTLQYVSVAVVAAVIGALIYTYIPRGR